MSSSLVLYRVYRLGIHVGIFDRLCKLLPLQPSLWLALPPPLPCVNKYTYIYTSIQCVRGEGGRGHRRGGSHRQIKHLPQSPFTGQFF